MREAKAPSTSRRRSKTDRETKDKRDGTERPKDKKGETDRETKGKSHVYIIYLS